MDTIKRIFISRDLENESPFHILKKQGYEIISRSLITFKALEITEKISSDWIFFYSKNGVKFFFQSQEYSTDYQYAVMGPGTAAKFYQVTGRSPKYTGNGNPQDVADNFIRYEKEKSMTFAKAKNSLGSIREILEGHMDCSDVEVYNNVIAEDLEIPKCEFLIFTSPLNTRAYFQNYSYENQVMVAIGKSTAECIKEITGVQVDYCDEPSETNMYQLLLNKL